MTPVLALTVLLCIYAAGELIAQRTKAVFSTVLGIALLLLAGFWSGVLPRSLIEDAQVTGFGNVIAGLLIVSLGTTIDFAELRRQWKVVLTALFCVCGAVAVIILIGMPLIGRDMSIAGAPIFAGGSAATLIMTSALDEMGLAQASTFCIVLYVTQKFIGVPIASLLLRRTARQFREDAKLVAEYSEAQQGEASAQKRGSSLFASRICPPVRLSRKTGAYSTGRLLPFPTDRRRHSLLCALPDYGRCIFRGGIFRERNFGENQVQFFDYFFCHYFDFLQFVHHITAAGCIRFACTAAFRNLRRQRHRNCRLCLRQTAAHSLCTVYFPRYQLHLRLPYHHADSTGSCGSVWPQRTGKGRNTQLLTAKNADSWIRHRYHRLGFTGGYRGTYAVSR